MGSSPPSAVWHEQVSHPLWALVSASVGVNHLSQGALPHTPFPSPPGDLHLSLNYWPPTPLLLPTTLHGPLILTSSTRQSLETQTVVQGPAHLLHLLGRQHPRPHPRPTEPGSLVKLDPWVVCVHRKA